MALDGDSTLAEVQAQYDANAGYRSDATGAKALLFVEAALILKRRVPASMGSAAGSVARSDFAAEIANAEAFIRATNAGSGFTRGRCV